MIIILKISHTHNQWPCMKIKSCKKHQFVVSVPKVFIITIHEEIHVTYKHIHVVIVIKILHTHNQWSCMKKNHVWANQFVVIFKNFV